MDSNAILKAPKPKRSQGKAACLEESLVSCKIRPITNLLLKKRGKKEKEGGK